MVENVLIWYFYVVVGFIMTINPFMVTTQLFVSWNGDFHRLQHNYLMLRSMEDLVVTISE